MYICVSGNLGSGKTTLAKNLGALLGWQVVPTSSYDGSYLIDLFSNPSRWAFEAQSAFLLHKFRHIANALKHERPFIVDRSMSEDVHVFCKYFHVNNLMEARSYELLSNLYQILAPQIELPAITIFCQSSAEVCQERALKRKREYQNLYPADHFAKLGGIYADWVKAQSDTLLLEVNTTAHDVRDSQVVQAILDDINDVLETYYSPLQLNLFELEVLHPQQKGIARVIGKPQRIPSPPKVLGSRRLRVYLAAPFTTLATSQSAPENKDWFDNTNASSTAVIPRGRYRNALRSLVAALESWNYDVILPHQDINKWGFNNLSHKEIAERCLDAVKHADAFVGLIGDSYGAHTELGVAIGAELPSLVVLLADANTSFFGAAVSQSKYVKAVRAASIAKAISMFKQEDLIRHLLF